jgi:hypothetical protein
MKMMFGFVARGARAQPVSGMVPARNAPAQSAWRKRRREGLSGGNCIGRGVIGQIENLRGTDWRGVVGLPDWNFVKSIVKKREIAESERTG